MLTEKLILKTSPLSGCRIERILYTTDLPPETDEALGYAITLARTYNAKLFFCHCLELTAPKPTDQELAYINQTFRESIATYISPTDPPELDWEGIVVRGITASTIIKVAEMQNVDLIMMRSRRRPYAAALLGSVAETVSRSAPCPVFVIHPDEREWFDSSTGLYSVERILVAYDFSEYSKLALSYALSFAGVFGSELHLLHVLPADTDGSWSPLFGNPTYTWENWLKEAPTGNLISKDKIKYSVVEGEPYHEILTYAREKEIDLVSIGAHSQYPDQWAPFGSTVDRVMRQITCPIFIAR